MRSPAEQVAPGAIRVSVIVPTYNRAHLLSRALESIVTQGEPSFEVIVVDDRSGDDTKEVVSRFSTRCPEVRYVTNERRRGPAGARNYGLQLASGDFIAFLDSDDTWAPNHLAAAMSLMETEPALDWLQGNLERVRNDVVVTRSYFSEVTPDVCRFPARQRGSVRLLDQALLLERAIDYAWPCYVQASVFRRRVFDRLRFCEDLFGVEDYDFLLRFLATGGTIALDEQIHLRYLIHDANISSAAGANAEKTIERATEMRKLWARALVNGDLRGRARANIRRRLAELHLWHFGYNGYYRKNDGLRGTGHVVAALRYGYDRPAVWLAVARAPLGYSWARFVNVLRWRQRMSRLFRRKLLR